MGFYCLYKERLAEFLEKWGKEGAQEHRMQIKGFREFYAKEIYKQIKEET